MEIKKEEFTGEIGRGREPKYPFAELQEGDCLTIEVGKDIDPKAERARVSNAFYGWRKYNSKTDWVTAVRLEENDGKKVVKVYRMKAKKKK